MHESIAVSFMITMWLQRKSSVKELLKFWGQIVMYKNISDRKSRNYLKGIGI